MKHLLLNSSFTKGAGAILLLLYFTRTFFRHYSKNKKEAYMLSLALKKRQERDLIISKYEYPEISLSYQMKETILNSSASQLLELLNDEKITSEQILVLYAQRAHTIGKEHNFIAETNFEEALKMARSCDIKRLSTPKSERKNLGLLFGIPISIKDCIEQKNFDSTCGCASLVFKPKSNDSLIIQLLLQQGAIPFIRSNVPQALWSFETNSYIWGRSINPWDTSRTTGGSTGGEAGLIASRCSPLGIGSDIGGSIRMPSLYCGIYGFKPTSGRISKIGLTIFTKEGIIGNIAIQSSPGPMGKSVKDLRLVMECLVSKEAIAHDPRVIPKIWDKSWDNPNKPLRLGYIINTDFMPVNPAQERAIKHTIQGLKDKGHEVLELDFPYMKDGFLVYLALMTAEGRLRTVYEGIKDERLAPEFDNLKRLASLPEWFRPVLVSLLRLLGKKTDAETLMAMRPKSAAEYQDYIKKMISIQNGVINIIKEKKIDGIICPGLALPAIHHKQSNYLLHNYCYAIFWNLVNFPAGVLPITKIQSDEQIFTSGNNHNDRFSKHARLAMKESEGLPIGVQVATLPNEDEKCLHIMQEIEDVVDFHEYAI